MPRLLPFAPTEANQEHLVREDIPASQIFVTGNSGIDALHWAVGLEVPFSDAKVEEAATCSDRLVVVTAHRRESWGGGLQQRRRGRRRDRAHPLRRAHRRAAAPEPSRARGDERPALRAGQRAAHRAAGVRRVRAPAVARTLVVTDSGGIQEEAPSLGKPVLVARETTERTEGVEAGTLRLVGTDPGRIELEGGLLLDDAAAYARMANAPNPYGDGHAAQRIVAALEKLRHGGRAARAVRRPATRGPP